MASLPLKRKPRFYDTLRLSKMSRKGITMQPFHYLYKSIIGVRDWTFHQYVNRAAGVILLLLAALYSIPSVSSIELSRATGGVVSIRNLSAVFLICGSLLVIRHWKPSIAFFLTLPAFVLAVFNTIFLLRMLSQAIESGVSAALVRPVWPPSFYFGFIVLFWGCKLYELRHVAKPTHA